MRLECTYNVLTMSNRAEYYAYYIVRGIVRTKLEL
jgi:hypothetical protein